MVDISAALVMAGQAIGIVKDLREIDKGLDVAEFKAKMAELYGKLADVKMALADAQEELRDQKTALVEMSKNFTFRGDLVEYHGFKYEAFVDGTPKGSAFCPRCEQNKGRFYRLTSYGQGRNNMQCPECKAEFAHVSGFSWSQE